MDKQVKSAIIIVLFCRYKRTFKLYGRVYWLMRLCCQLTY